MLYRSAFIPVAALILVGPQLGLAQAALDYVIEKGHKRGIAYTEYELQRDAPTFQLAIAKAATLVDTAHLFAYRAAGDIDDAARADRTMTYVERARVRMDTGHAAESAREAIRVLCSAHGASSFAEVEPDAAVVARLRDRQPSRRREPRDQRPGLWSGADGVHRRDHVPGVIPALSQHAQNTLIPIRREPR